MDPTTTTLVLAEIPGEASGDVARHIDLLFLRTEIGGRLISTIGIIILLLIIRSILVRRIRLTGTISKEDKSRYLVSVRNGTLLLMVLGIFFVWAEQIQTFAASLVVIAAAIVIATKELILCLSGSFLRASSRSFNVGDRIEISGLRGDVINRTAFATTILEIGPGQTSHQHTGRAITLPNSVFVTAPVINETFTQDYVLHPFSIPISAEQDWKRAEQLLLSIAQEECTPFIADARRHMEAQMDRHALESPNVDPRVSIQVPEPGKIVLLARIPAPARRKGRMEQSIIRRFLEEFYVKEQQGEL